MWNNYINNSHHPLEYSPHGYWAPMQPYSMVLLQLPLISHSIFEGQHMNSQCMHTSWNDPKQLQTMNQNGMMTSFTTLCGNTWGKHYDGCPSANAYNYRNTWMTYHPLQNDSKLLITNMMANALNVNNYGRIWTMFYVAPAKPENRPEMMHSTSYVPTSRNNIPLLSWLIYFVAAWNTGFIDAESHCHNGIFLKNPLWLQSHLLSTLKNRLDGINFSMDSYQWHGSK